MDPSPAPPRYTLLDFNAPLSETRARTITSGLLPTQDAHVLDLGCGWAELLLRVLESAPDVTGTGIDADATAIRRGRANAERRGLADRVRLDTGDAAATGEETADAVISIGAAHAWGGSRDALAALRGHVRPGGRLLLGDAFWEREPTPAALAALDAAPDDFNTLGGLADLAMSAGFRILSVSTANQDEWDDFESRFCAGSEQWLFAHPDAPEAADVRAAVDAHRNGWLHGYRGILGFAYLTLALPPAPAQRLP
ncbi:SAM-dependent methyltransferase [Murinocardiopsis flavida]|nr:class I SAM-dependent methyltransferase [Murinocardiopsis flavida]